MKKIFLCLAVLICLSACKKNKQIVFDESEPLSLAPDVSWAVVIDPYAAYRKDTDWSSEVIGHCRKGDILKVKGSAVFADSENWFLFDEGWLPESAVDVYSNKFKAQRASGQLK